MPKAPYATLLVATLACAPRGSTPPPISDAAPRIIVMPTNLIGTALSLGEMEALEEAVAARAPSLVGEPAMRVAGVQLRDSDRCTLPPSLRTQLYEEFPKGELRVQAYCPGTESDAPCYLDLQWASPWPAGLNGGGQRLAWWRAPVEQPQNPDQWLAAVRELAPYSPSQSAGLGFGAGGEQTEQERPPIEILEARVWGGELSERRRADLHQELARCAQSKRGGRGSEDYAAIFREDGKLAACTSDDRLAEAERRKHQRCVCNAIGRWGGVGEGRVALKLIDTTDSTTKPTYALRQVQPRGGLNPWAGLARLEPKLSACAQSAGPDESEVAIEIDVTDTGEISESRIRSGAGPSPLSICVEQTLRGASFGCPTRLRPRDLNTQQQRRARLHPGVDLRLVVQR